MEHNLNKAEYGEGVAKQRILKFMLENKQRRFAKEIKIGRLANIKIFRYKDILQSSVIKEMSCEFMNQ